MTPRGHSSYKPLVFATTKYNNFSVVGRGRYLRAQGYVGGPTVRCYLRFRIRHIIGRVVYIFATF